MLPAPLLPVFAGPHRQLLEFRSDAFRPGSLNVGGADLVKWAEGKEPRAIGHWRDLGADEYGRAFTAARTAGYDIIDDLYYAFADTLERRGNQEDFAKLVVPTLRAKGWLGGDGQAIGNRVALIYDTNLRVARGAGQWDRVQRSARTLPYLRAVTVRDQRVRHPPKSRDSDHRAWDGILLPVDHPFWTRWWVPLGFRCRCSIIPMTRAQLARWKGGITSDAELAEREARLGVPLFTAPGAGVKAQLDSMVERVNTKPVALAGEIGPDYRMPGRPDVSVAAERANGLALWEAETAGMVIDALLARLFG